MLRFLSKFSLATRIYTGFLFLGVYVVAICFGAMFAVGYVHGEYVRADSLIENTRQLSALEAYLFSLNRSLFFFAAKGTEEEKNNVSDAFTVFEEKAQELENGLDNEKVREKYKSVLTDTLEKYRQSMTEMFSLHEKSAEAAGKVNDYAEKSSSRLNALIEETTLPSASFALNALREQLDAVLRSIDNATAENEESRKQLNADFAALKKAQNAAQQVEMINVKQLKAVSGFMRRLNDEINRKLNIDASLREKMQSVSVLGDQVSKDFKDVITMTAQACAQLLAQADEGKIALQRWFVFAAAFGGILAVVLSFLSLLGIHYPLTRLIENAREMARGDRSVLIHFTERDDEVGALAKALAGVLVRLGHMPVLTDEALMERKSITTSTYGASVAYVPLGAPTPAGALSATESDGGDEIAYFGQGVGVDAESQLCQMLSLLQHIGDSATTMTTEIKERFTDCRQNLFDLTEALQHIGKDISTVRTKSDVRPLEQVCDRMAEVLDSFSVCFDLIREMERLLKTQSDCSDAAADGMEQMQNFASGLMKWTGVAGELTDMIRASSAETKILALNASIEAAKAGEAAKSFGAVSLDMRHRTHKTADVAERLVSHLADAQKEIVRFAETMKTTATNVAGFRQAVQALRPVQDNQAGRMQAMLSMAETVKKDIGKYIDDNAALQKTAAALPETIAKAEELPPVMEAHLARAENQLDKFNSALPTYEEDRENGEE